MNSKAISWLLHLLLLCSITGCKLIVVVPPGGEVIASHGLTCAADSNCSITVDDDTFESTFTAVPAPGYAFAGWRKSPRYFCGESRDPCHLSTLNFTDYPALVAILASEEEFWLEPLFVREDVLIYKNGNSLLKVSFEGAVSEITSEGSPEPFRFWLSPDGSRVAYSNEGIIEDQSVLEIVRLDTLSLESRVTGVFPYRVWFGNSRSLVVRAVSGLARVDAGSDIPIVFLETPTPMAEEIVRLGVGRPRVATNRLSISLRIFEPLAFEPSETRFYAYEYGDPEAQLVISSVSTNSNDLLLFWSPDETTVVYQARHERGPIHPNVAENIPAGPLMARLADGSTRIIYDPEADRPRDLSGRDLRLWAWLSQDQMLLRGPYSFEIRNLEGEIQLVMGGRSLPSPDLRKIAFQAENTVYLLELDTAESILLGPGAVNIAIHSTLKWSSDSRFLAWNYWEFETRSEKEWLYTHDNLTGTTELVRRMVSYNFGTGGDFEWSPNLNLLNYINKDGDQLKHLIRNPITGKQAVVREGTTLTRYIRDENTSLWTDSASSVYTGVLPHLTIHSFRKKFADQTVRLMPSPSGDYILIQEFYGDNPEWYLHLIGTSKIEPVSGTTGVPLRADNFKFLH